MSELLEKSLRALIADVLAHREASTVDDLTRIFPAVERADLERLYMALTLPADEALGAHGAAVARAAGATRVRHLGGRRFLILAPGDPIRFLADEGDGAVDTGDEAFAIDWWLDTIASRLPIQWEETDYAGPDGQHYAGVQIRWAELTRVLGHEPAGDPVEDAGLKIALQASGAPAWVIEADEGWTDEVGWGLIGPRLAQ
jgi:hypothetical protein